MDSFSYASQSPETFRAISIPEALGQVDEVFHGNPDKTILYLLDAHDSLEAQVKIAKMILRLVRQNGVRTVFEEGYEGEVPTGTFFGFLRNRKVREKVAYFLLDRLRIGGAEYAHINREKDFKLIGVDSLALYLENLSWYRKAARKRKETEQDLERLHHAIRDLSHRYWPRGLNQWVQMKERLEAGEIDLATYLQRMPYRDFPDLVLLLSGRHSTLSPKDIFREMEAMEEEFTRPFLKNERDRKIFEFSKAISLLRRFNRMEVTAPEVDFLKAKIEGLKTRPLAEFLARHAGRTIVLSNQWEENLNALFRFYETARARDEALEGGLNDFLENDQESLAVLVFGGFHKERIREILKRKGLSYTIVSPAIQNIDPKHRNYYRRLMSGSDHPFEAPFLPPQVLRAESYLVRALSTGDEPVQDLVTHLAAKYGLSVYEGLESQRSEARAADIGQIDIGEVVSLLDKPKKSKNQEEALDVLLAFLGVESPEALSDRQRGQLPGILLKIIEKSGKPRIAKKALLALKLLGSTLDFIKPQLEKLLKLGLDDEVNDEIRATLTHLFPPAPKKAKPKTKSLPAPEPPPAPAPEPALKPVPEPAPGPVQEAPPPEIQAPGLSSEEAEKLKKNLKDQDIGIREEAVSRLSLFGQQGYRILLEVFERGERLWIKESAARGLLQVKGIDPWGVINNVLLPILLGASHDQRLRLAAASAIQSMGDDGFRLLHRMLYEAKTREAKEAAAYGLAQSGEYENRWPGLNTLSGAFNSSDEETGMAAAFGLARLENVRKDLPGVRILHSAMFNENPGIIRRAAYGLSKNKLSGSSILLTILKDAGVPKPNREIAAHALARNEKDGLFILEDMLRENPDPEVREIAAEALFNIEHPKLDDLRKALLEDDLEKCLEEARSLIQGVGVFLIFQNALLAGALNHPKNETLRVKAAVVIALFVKNGVGWLNRVIIHNPDPGVKKAAAYGLSQGDIPNYRRLTGIFQGILNNPSSDPQTKEAAIFGLAHSGWGGLEILQKELGTKTDEATRKMLESGIALYKALHPEEAAETTPSGETLVRLKQDLYHPDPVAREKAVKELSGFGREGYKVLLEVFYEAKELKIKETAARGLLRVERYGVSREEVLHRILLPALLDDSLDRALQFAAASAIASLGQEGLGILQKRLNAGSQEVRKAAAFGIARLGKLEENWPAVRILSGALNDPDDLTAKAAAFGLIHIGNVEEDLPGLRILHATAVREKPSTARAAAYGLSQTQRGAGILRSIVTDGKVSPENREIAARHLVLNRWGGIGLLQKELSWNPDPLVRKLAAEALFNFEDSTLTAKDAPAPMRWDRKTAAKLEVSLPAAPDKSGVSGAAGFLQPPEPETEGVPALARSTRAGGGEAMRSRPLTDLRAALLGGDLESLERARRLALDLVGPRDLFLQILLNGALNHPENERLRLRAADVIAYSLPEGIGWLTRVIHESPDLRVKKAAAYGLAQLNRSGAWEVPRILVGIFKSDHADLITKEAVVFGLAHSSKGGLKFLQEELGSAPDDATRQMLQSGITLAGGLSQTAVVRSEMRQNEMMDIAKKVENLRGLKAAKGTLLMDRSELRELTADEWDAFYIAAHLNLSRVVIYGDDQQEDFRSAQLRRLPNVIFPTDGAREALAGSLPNRPAVFLTLAGLSDSPAKLFGTRWSPRIKFVKLGEGVGAVGLALLYVIHDGRLPFVRENAFYLSDPAGVYQDETEAYLAHQVIAWSA